MRLILTEEPFNTHKDQWMQQGKWPAKWITHPEINTEASSLTAYRCKFNLAKNTTLRIHVTADQRYQLYLDGERIGYGPERGDRDNWFYESYDLNLTAGEHIIVARTWWLIPAWTFNGAPYAQMSVKPAFLLAVENAPSELLNTGFAPWQCKILGGIKWLGPDMCWGTGCNTDITASEFDWDFHTGNGDGWVQAREMEQAASASSANEYMPIWKLRPSTLPPMMNDHAQAGVARHAQEVNTDQLRDIPVKRAESIIPEEDQWNSLLSGSASLTIPANTMRRIIIDLQEYYCAYPEVTTSGGKDAIIRIQWAESLFEQNDKPDKGNRNEVEGKYFIGTGDIFRPDGASGRVFEPFWWESGRYLEVYIKTADEPLTINNFRLREDHYPYTRDCKFEASDSRLSDVIPVMQRALEMCSHETYMDCPYYEQLMYIGDTRLEVLATYTMTQDDRLPKKALYMFDASRTVSGITQSRYPSSVMQIIPPFSLWWVSMLHDYAMWRDDLGFVADRMPGVRAVLDRFRSWVNADDLVEGPVGWNFTDWVPGWDWGVPPDGAFGVSGIINWQFVYTLKLAAQLEEMLNEPELAFRNRKLANRVAEAATKKFWSEEKGLFAETLAKESFSEHSQCLALLADAVPSDKRDRVINGLLNDPDLARTTIYFTHYLFETYRLIHRMDRFIERMSLWFDLVKNGLKTTIETPEPSRSDCHAWGAHPMYHYFASILGIRPSAPGFAEVLIIPQLVGMTSARGTLPHPKGSIKVDLSVVNGKLKGTIELPEKVKGKLIYEGKETNLKPGKQSI